MEVGHAAKTTRACRPMTPSSVPPGRARPRAPILGRMKVILFGATGMVGTGALIECLEDPRVTAVVAITRAPTGRQHPKLREVVHADFMSYADVSDEFAGAGAVFFCLGVTSLGKDEAAYTRLTYDLTMAAAKAIAAVATDLTFCYVTGVGTDSSERGRVMWARVEGAHRECPAGHAVQGRVHVPARLHPADEGGRVRKRPGTRRSTRCWARSIRWSRASRPGRSRPPKRSGGP